MKVKFNELKIGQKIKVIKPYQDDKNEIKAEDARIIGLLEGGEDYKHECDLGFLREQIGYYNWRDSLMLVKLENTSDDQNKNKFQILHFSFYKLDPFRTCDYTWCFENSFKYLKSLKYRSSSACVERLKARHESELNKYSNLSHDNNKNQLQAVLSPQRDFMQRVLEQGYVWINTINGFVKENNLDRIKFEFKNNRYYCRTEYGEIRGNKFGRVLKLDLTSEDKEAPSYYQPNPSYYQSK